MEGGRLIARWSKLWTRITTEATGLGGKMKEVTIYAPIRILILVDDDGVSPRLKEQRDALGQGINRRGKCLDRLLEIVLSRTLYRD